MSQLIIPDEVAYNGTKKSRHWFLTKANPTDTLEEFTDMARQHTTYVRAQIEKAASGLVHIQACVGFKNQLHHKSIIKRFPGCHVMVTRNPSAAYDYCGKEDTRIEGPITHGIPPARLNVAGDKKAFNLKVLEIGPEQAVDQGLIKITDYQKLKSNLDLYKACTQKLDSVPMDNEWIYGAPGVGKTRGVIDRYPDDLYEKDKSKYWNGYTNQQTVLIDDLEEDETFMLAMLKKICQEKPFMAEDKFGQMRPIRPKKIIVTSNFHFTHIWKKELDQAALQRRFTVHHLLDPFPKGGVQIIV